MKKLLVVSLLGAISLDLGGCNNRYYQLESEGYIETVTPVYRMTTTHFKKSKTDLRCDYKIRVGQDVFTERRFGACRYSVGEKVKVKSQYLKKTNQFIRYSFSRHN